jgi:hypothetical protein
MIEHKPFFYVIEHIPSGKRYIGSKWSSDPARLATPSQFMVEGGYQTSSKSVKELIKRDGLDSFAINEIVLESEITGFNSIFEYEIYRLKEVNAGTNPEYLNKTDGVVIKDQISDRYYWELREHDNEIKFSSDELSIYWQFQDYDLNLVVRNREESNKAKELVSRIQKFLRTRSLSKITPEEVGLPQSYKKWRPEHLQQVIYDLENRFATIRKIYRKRLSRLE